MCEQIGFSVLVLEGKGLYQRLFYPGLGFVPEAVTNDLLHRIRQVASVIKSGLSFISHGRAIKFNLNPMYLYFSFSFHITTYNPSDALSTFLSYPRN